MTLRLLVFALAFIGATTVSAQALPFDYTYSTTLALASGDDTAGLNGATVTITEQFDTSDVYVEGVNGYTKVVGSGGTYAITGGAIPDNDGTYTIPGSLAFYPTLASLSTDPDGVYPQLPLPSLQFLTAVMYLQPTATGALANVGDTVQLSDFAPATSHAPYFSVDVNSAFYTENDTSVFTTDISSVPEPFSYCGWFVVAFAALMSWRRFFSRSA